MLVQKWRLGNGTATATTAVKERPDKLTGFSDLVSLCQVIVFWFVRGGFSVCLTLHSVLKVNLSDVYGDGEWECAVSDDGGIVDGFANNAAVSFKSLATLIKVSFGLSLSLSLSPSLSPSLSLSLSLFVSLSLCSAIAEARQRQR